MHGVSTCPERINVSGIGLTPFFIGKSRLEIGQVESELGVSTVNPESEGLVSFAYNLHRHYKPPARGVYCAQPVGSSD